MKKRVLVLGELNVDLILNNISGTPEIGTEKIAEEMNLTLGSSSAIFASNLSFQNTHVSFLGMIGNDQFGQLVKSSLEKKKVNTALIIESEEFNTGVTVVMNYGMDRAMITYPGAMNHLSIEHFEDIDLSNFDHIHISSIFLQPLIRKNILKILTNAKSHQLTTSLDPQWDPVQKWDLSLQDILPLIDVFLPNKEEFLALSDSTEITDGIKKLEGMANIIVIKKGDEGALLICDGKQLSIPAFLNNNVTDCIGAGDSFDAGFVYGYIHKLPIKQCLERGSIMGAISTTSFGGTSAFSSLENVQRLSQEKFIYKFII